ncbi:nucleotidyltransferase family protein [Pseudalkalibacillus sp. R45]|uniref:nucleotidyltransferase family protein n=1 Tax=Pseudalkalibacillus sp. R45 TaxID=3457433 RepID=UPI003FCCE597
MDEGFEKETENKLRRLIPEIPWSVKNEARMRLVNHIRPYSSSLDAISKFLETATSLGLKVNEVDQVELAAPCGIEDVLNLEVKPTHYFNDTRELASNYANRIIEKNGKRYGIKSRSYISKGSLLVYKGGVQC